MSPYGPPKQQEPVIQEEEEEEDDEEEEEEQPPAAPSEEQEEEDEDDIPSPQYEPAAAVSKTVTPAPKISSAGPGKTPDDKKLHRPSKSVPGTPKIPVEVTSGKLYDRVIIFCWSGSVQQRFWVSKLQFLSKCLTKLFSNC
jgi:hypothetical protein